MKATLILENGTTFVGESIGCVDEQVCQLVFNTSMVGYQEILTDPSYAGQGIVMSYPLIGNYGVNSEDNESSRVWAKALVIRCLSPRGSNFRNEGTLEDYLKLHHITGIQGVDTRALTKILRNQGTMNAMITCAEHFDMQAVLEQLKAYKVGKHIDAATVSATVICPAEAEQYRVALLDLGEKRSSVEALNQFGCTVDRLNAYTKAEEILAGGYAGVVVSNGPGDPALCPEIAAEVKVLMDAGIPVFGVGLGHQLMAMAVGAATEALHYGHRGASIPVRDVTTGKVFMTAQNHGYAVKTDSLNAAAQISHVNVNDGSCEGLSYPGKKAFSVQFAPETRDSRHLYGKFLAMMGEKEGAVHA